MFGHDHVAHDYEVVTPADLLQNLEERIPVLRTGEQSPPLVTACGDEVEVSGAVVTVESFGHVEFLARNSACGMGNGTLTSAWFGSGNGIGRDSCAGGADSHSSAPLRAGSVEKRDGWGSLGRGVRAPCVV
jgi:hypothetical protein